MYNFKNETAKSLIKKKVRQFFDSKGFIEVDTPLLSPLTIPEHTIKLFKTIREGEFTKSENLFLLPSPEYYMKKMLSLYKKPIYQITKSFRNAEQTSPVHRNEFTMLEFYKPYCDSDYMLNLTIQFIKYVLDKIANTHIYTVDELLKKYVSVSLEELHKDHNKKEIEKKFSISLPLSEDFDDTFNRVFLNVIEPEISKIEGIVAIKDYPVEIECLAKKKNNLTRERFEIYIDGIEIANGYGEMTDEDEIKKLFESEERKISDKQAIDKDFCNIGLMESSGVAIGLDRLIMSALNIKDIKDLNFY